jgi:Methyltransferase domain
LLLYWNVEDLEMSDRDRADIEMAAHYGGGIEETRLATWGRLEFTRTMEILRRYLPVPPATIADVGGGPGVYAWPLAIDGYAVHLLDPMSLHIEQALAASPGSGKAELASAQVGEALALPWSDETIDVVLLLGPLYHLTEAEDRIASTYDGLSRGFLTEPRFTAIVKRDIQEGQHRNPERHPDWFTTAYLHHPDELEAEIHQSGGFGIDAVLAVEGPAGWLGNLDWWLGDSKREEALMETIRQVESERSLLGASPHLLVVAHRQ